jgi:hypothetical protein
VQIGPDMAHVHALSPTILTFVNTDISRYILVLNTFVFMKANMSWSEYIICVYKPTLVENRPNVQGEFEF